MGACAGAASCKRNRPLTPRRRLRSWLNNIGLLKLALRDADGAEVHVSSLLTQIVRARPRLLCNVLCAHAWSCSAAAMRGSARVRALTARFATQTKTGDGFTRRFVSPL